MSAYYRTQRKEPESLSAPSAPPTPSETISPPQRTGQYRAVPQNPPPSKNIEIPSPKPVQSAVDANQNKNLVLPSPKPIQRDGPPNKTIVLPPPKQFYNYQQPPPKVVYVVGRPPAPDHRQHNRLYFSIFVACVIVSIILTLLLVYSS
jgi:hypothetical protein